MPRATRVRMSMSGSSNHQALAEASTAVRTGSPPPCATGSEGRTGGRIEIRALQALAHAADGDHPAALTTLAGALTLGATEGYVRVLVDEGPPMAALVGKLLAAGQTNRGIAQELVVTLDTVKRHVSHLFAKLQETNRTQAVARARQLACSPDHPRCGPLPRWWTPGCRKIPLEVPSSGNALPHPGPYRAGR
jgi:hypothetical protein